MILGITMPWSFRLSAFSPVRHRQPLLIIAIICHTIGAFALKYCVLKVGIYGPIFPRVADVLGCQVTRTGTNGSTTMQTQSAEREKSEDFNHLQELSRRLRCQGHGGGRRDRPYRGQPRLADPGHDVLQGAVEHPAYRQPLPDQVPHEAGRRQGRGQMEAHLLGRSAGYHRRQDQGRQARIRKESIAISQGTGRGYNRYIHADCAVHRNRQRDHARATCATARGSASTAW